MNFLNNIGQRAASKYIFVISIIVALIIYGLKIKGIGISNSPANIMTIVLGITLFSMSNLLLCIAAHKSRAHRVMAIFTSFIILLLNTILFALSLYSPSLSKFLFGVSVIEIVFAIIFLIVAVRMENIRQKTKVSKATETVTINQTVDSKI